MAPTLSDPARTADLMIKILFLGANPTGTTQLALSGEAEAIQQRLRGADHGHQLQVEHEWAVKISDVNAALLRHRPDIVHFSGHGGRAGELILESEPGTAVPVKPDALANLFMISRENTRCVVLNACFSTSQAKAIAKHIDCVVGMSIAVGDTAATAFAWAFYEALALNSSVQEAFALGCKRVDLSRLPDRDSPRLIWHPAIRAIKPEKPYFLGQGAPIDGVSPSTPGAGGETDPPEIDGAAGRRVEEERYDARVARIINGVAETLEKQPRIAEALAQKLLVTAAPGEVARVVAREIVSVRKAGDIATALNDVDSKLAKGGADLADRAAVRTLLWQILPLVIDWRQLVVTGRATLEGGANAIELPLRTDTVAEIVLAGINERCCNFAPLAAASMPVGAALVRLPAAAQTALFDVDGSRLAQLIVLELAAEVHIEAKYTRYPDMRAAVEGTLIYRASEAPEDERLPYYLLFVDADLGEKEGTHDLWALARTAIGRELPSLRLVRLTGDALKNEMVLARHIEAIMRRTP